MRNSELAALFREMVHLLEIQGGDAFRLRSYEQAARTLEDLTEQVTDLAGEGKKLTDLPGIGKSHAEKIEEILKTGTCARLEELRKGSPPGITELLRLKGMGPKTVKLLWERLKISTLAQLKAAAEAGKIRQLPGLGEKTEEHILRALKTVAAQAGRISIYEAVELVEELGRYLDSQKKVARRWTVAGSFRRRVETVGDLDVLIEATDRAAATEALGKFPGLAEIAARGPEKVEAALQGGFQVDFRFFEADNFGAALLYFTGSKAHGIALRKIAQQKKLKLNEYGLFRGEKPVAGKTEEEIYAALGLKFIPPELREDRGEVEAAVAGKLPDLVELGDLRGDLHAHTTETDGHDTIAAMAEAARQRGYQYLAITDHSKAVTVAHGMDEKRLGKHAAAVRKVGAGLKGLTLLAGIEVDILKDGRLDLAADALKDLDWVIASVHSYFEMSEAAMTERIVRAVSSGVVHCLGHPFGRLIGQRDPIVFDVDKVFAACKKHSVVLEINAHPDRLDLPDVYCQRAKEMGLKMVISTDAHRTTDLGMIELGVWVARRGWLSKADVLNTATAAGLRKALARS
jgi:DNA polymerase (family 10)